jgi:class 3 adenylate cyclase/tetratricopeptide (TPR) repeat protein
MRCGTRLAAELRPEARKPVSILFNDITGSTGLGERFEPETVRRVMASYFDAVSEVCERHGGSVEKFIGDAVMAVFGIPTAFEDHALRAVRAASELKEALAPLNEELERDRGARISTRTGVSSGEVVAGDPAGGQALATGDAVNVAARLEQHAAPGEVLIGDATRLLLGETVVAERVEPLAVKGRAAPITAWRLLEVVSRAGQPRRRLDAPMLGRDRQLAALQEAFDRVRDERTAHRATVLGPAGIGKSRLAHELKAAIGNEGRVLIGNCLPYGEGITFWPLAEIVGQIGGDHPRDAIAELLTGERHAGLIADRVLQAVGLSEGAAAGQDLIWALRRFFEALARERPLVLVLEDLHWAETPLLDLVDYLTEWTRAAPLMLLCLAREEVLERRPDWSASDATTSAIVLEPLSEDDTGTLVDRALPRDGDARVRAELIERAEGNPLFVEQMLALLREQEPDAKAIAVPPTIQAVLAARLDRLPLAELEVVGAASVVGKEFWRGALEALSADASRFEGTLAALVRKELIRPDVSMLPGEEGFSFRHVLIRDAAYEALTKRSRADLHERFADWLEGSHPDRLVEFEAILGYHLEQACGYRIELAPVDERVRTLARRGAGRLSSAGRRAARAREDAAALNLLSRASALLPPTAPERLELLPAIGEALVGTANQTKAVDVFTEALEAALTTGRKDIEGWARLGRVQVWFVANPEMSVEEIAAETERAIAILEQGGDAGHLAEAWRLLGDSRMYGGRAARGQRALERALGYLGPDVSPRTQNAVLFSLGMCLLDGPTPLDRAVAFAEERLELARAGGLRSLEADMLHVLGAGEARQARFGPARLSLESSTAISEELGLTYMAQWSKRTLGQLELWAGEPRAAEEVLRWSYDLLSKMGLNSSLGETAVPLANALYEQGRYEEAERFLEAVKEDWAKGDASVEAPRLAVRAKLLAARGWDEHAERAARRALALVSKTDWACLRADTLLAHAAVMRTADRGEEAARSLKEALRVALEKGYEAGARRARSELEQLDVVVTEKAYRSS